MSENEWDDKLKEFFLYDQETKVAVCNLCNKNVSFKNSIVNLIQHLALAHPDTLLDSFPIVISNEVECQDDNSESIKIACDFNNLFDIDQDSEIATCTLCQDNVLKNSTRSHLKQKHVDVYNNFIVSESNVKNEDNVSEVENCSDQEDGLNSNREDSSEAIIDDLVTDNNTNEQYLETDEEYLIISPDENGSSRRALKCTNDIWKLFTRIGNSERAICMKCNKNVSFKNRITNLMEHLKVRHPDLYNTYKISHSALQKKVPKIKIGRETLLNDVWDVFERIKNTKMASCTLCQNILSYKTTIANLKNHIRRKHPKICNFDSKTPKFRKHNSHILASWWKLFNRNQNTKTATCRVCQRVVSYKSTSGNLKTHLRRIHPVIYHKTITSSKSPSQNNSEEENNSEENTAKGEKGLYRENDSVESEENIWKNFEKKIEDIACSEQYSGSEGENGARGGNDTEEESGLEENNSQLEHILENNSKIASRRRSKIWFFYKRHSNNEKATCKLCQNVMSFKTTISNLKKHIKCKHPYIYYKYFTLSKSATPPKIDFDEQSGSKGHLRNKHLNTLKTSKSDLTLGERHEVYIKAGKEKDQTKEILLGFHDNSDSDSVSGDNKQMDPLYEDEGINVKQPLSKKKRLSTINSTVNIQQNEKKDIDRCLLKLITKNFHPLNIVEDIGFREFVAALNPNYQLPSRQMLTNLLTEEFSNRQAKYSQITHNCSSVSLSLDCWSSCNMQRFMTVTAHFIDQSTYEFFSVLINCAALHGQHTAEKIASELLQVANKCNITDKVKFVVTDNASNLISATQILNWPQYACFARKFSLMVQGALNECSLAEIVTKVQKIVAYMKSSSLAKEMLRKYQVEDHVAQPKSLSLSIPTQWMTIYKMLKRCSESQQAVRATIANVYEEGKYSLISPEEWECVDQMVEVLKPFVEAANMIASENYLIASKAVVLTAGLYKVITDLAERDFHEPVKNLVLKLRNGLSTNYGNIETVEEIAICTLLDPRFKHHAFENQEALINTKKCVIGKMKRLNNESDSIKPASSSIVQTNSETSTLFGHFYTKVTSSYKPDDTDELNRYLSTNVIPPTECPLKWWKERRNLYPGLSRIFVDNFNIVVTSLPGDRVFSKSGNSISHRRTRLTTSKIDKIMFLNVNK